MARLEHEFSDWGALLIATAHAWRGQHDQAFAWLERSFERHEAGLMFMVRDPVMERLHDDPRWAAFLERMKLAVKG